MVLMPMSPDERSLLEARITREYKSEILWTKFWSFVHHGFLFAAAILSSCAAIVIELGFQIVGLDSKRSGAMLAAVSALASALAATGGFQRKWRTNRRTRGRLRTLLTDCS